MTDHPNLKPEDRALIELRACPFCGFKLVKSDALSTRNADAYVHPVVLSCPTMSTVLYSNSPEPIERWNKRASFDTARDEGRRAPGGEVIGELDGVISDLESSGWARAPGCIRTLKRIAASLAGRDEAALPEAEPVAFYNPEHWKRVGPGRGENCSTIYPVPAGTYRTPLYAAPPPPVTEVAGDVVRLVEAAFDSRNVGLNGTDYALGWDDAVRNCRADILAILADRVPSEAEEGKKQDCIPERVNDQCADAGPCPHSPVSWDDAPAGVTLWGVYGNDCFPTVFACKILDYPSGLRAIWGFSVYRRQPAFRTLGQNKEWADKNGLRLFMTREAAFASIAAYFPDDGGEAVHEQVSQPIRDEPVSSSPAEQGGE